jgi:SHS2 domain-containing protein
MAGTQKSDSGPQGQTGSRGASPPPAPDAVQFAYFDHDADIGIAGLGESIEAAFESAAAAMFSVMNPEMSSREGQVVTVEFDESDIEMALVRWLNALLAESRVRGLILSHFALARDGDHWTGTAQGAPCPLNVELGTEVKGATLTMLSVSPTPAGWEARCVVDV